MALEGLLERLALGDLARLFRPSHLVALEGLLERLVLGDLARLFRPSHLAVLVALRDLLHPSPLAVRAGLRLDQSQPPPGSRLRALRSNRRCVRSSRHDPHHAQAACCKRLLMNPNFPDGL